jgi:hypothetical protein
MDATARAAPEWAADREAGWARGATVTAALDDTATIRVHVLIVDTPFTKPGQ